VRGTDARIRVEAIRASAFDRELGGVAAPGCLFDRQRLAFQLDTGAAGVDPFDARITPFVVHDLRHTAPIGCLWRVAF